MAPVDSTRHREIVRAITSAQLTRGARAYARGRFIIINKKILDTISATLDRPDRVLEVGCGYGLFGCYLAMRHPEMEYHGIDIDEGRIRSAQAAAKRLGLTNIRFEAGDARTALDLDSEYDAVVMIDLLHHIPDESKANLLADVIPRIAPTGMLVIKEIETAPWWKVFFTWVLDVAMTKGFDMWYRDAAFYRRCVDPTFALESQPIWDILPYPHVLHRFARGPAEKAVG